MAFAVGLLVFLFLFFLQAHAPGRDRSTSFSDPINAALLIGASLSGISGASAALAAIIFKLERSIVLLPVVLLGLFVLFFTLGEIAGGH